MKGHLIYRERTLHMDMYLHLKCRGSGLEKPAFESCFCCTKVFLADEDRKFFSFMGKKVASHDFACTNPDLYPATELITDDEESAEGDPYASFVTPLKEDNVKQVFER